MTPEIGLLTALIIGFAGTPHCLGMCGGIAASLGAATASDDRSGRFRLALGYNIGRLSSYTLMGGLFAGLVALLGSTVSAPAWAVFARLATGLVMVAIAAHLLIDWRGLRRIEALGGFVWKGIGPVARSLLPVRNIGAALALGALWGWLPCGLVYTVLVAAALSADPATGATMMLVFGLGTLPAMTGVTVFGQAVRQWQGKRGLRRGLGLVLLLFAAWTLLSPVSKLLGNGHGHAHSGHGPQAAITLSAPGPCQSVPDTGAGFEPCG